MKLSLLAIAGTLALASVPAFAADQYVTSPTVAFADRVPSADVGSAQMPHFDGVAATVQSEQLLIRPGAEAEPESVNSETTAYHFR